MSYEAQDGDMDDLIESDYAEYSELKELYENEELFEAGEFYRLEELCEGYGWPYPSHWTPLEDIPWLNEEVAGGASAESEADDFYGEGDDDSGDFEEAGEEEGEPSESWWQRKWNKFASRWGR